MSNRILTSDGDFLVTHNGDYVVWTNPQTALMSTYISTGEETFANFACYLWTYQNYNQISLRLKNKSWAFEEYNQIQLSWGSCPVICGYWEEMQGDEIVLKFSETNWIDRQGNEIVLKFPECPAPLESQLSASISTGENLTASLLETYRGFIYTGEQLSADLDDNPAAKMSSDIATGEEVFASLSVFAQLQGLLSTGENLEGDLTRILPINLNSVLSTGEDLTAHLNTQSNLNALIETGEELIADLDDNPSAQLSVDLYHGEYLTGGLYEPPRLSAYIGTGEDLISHLNTTEKLVGFLYEGQELTASLTDKPGAQLETLIESGENVTADISAIYGLKGLVSSGENVIADMDFKPLEKFHTGEYVSADLSTLIVMKGVFSHGENVIADFTNNPPAGLSCDISTGEQVDGSLDFKYGRLLSARIGVGERLEGGIDATTHFDLNTTCCNGLEIPLREPDPFNIEMISYEEPASHYNHDAVKITANLRTAQRFSAYIGTGEEFKAEDRNIYLSTDISVGETLTRPNADSDINFRLCYGNFLLEPDDLFIEMTAITPECRSQATISTGEILSVSLSTQDHLSTVMSSGEYMGDDADLVFEGKWQAIIGIGERLQCELKTFPQFTDFASVTMSTGENLSANLTPDQNYSDFGAVNFFHGEAMQAPDELITDRYVSFLEGGCLPNEYMPQTPEGDPDLEKFNPVPIEFDRYRHEIKGKCE